MRKFISSLASLSLIIAAPLAAQSDEQEAAPAATEVAAGAEASTEDAAPKPAPKDDRGSEVKCKYQQVLGSKIPQRVCFTRDEWDERERQLLEEARGMKNRNSYCANEGRC